MGGTRAGEFQSIHQGGRQDQHWLALIPLCDLGRVMSEGTFSREAFVAVSDDPREAVILDGFADDAVTVQDGPTTVGAGSGHVSGSSVDGGHGEA